MSAVGRPPGILPQEFAETVALLDKQDSSSGPCQNEYLPHADPRRSPPMSLSLSLSMCKHQYCLKHTSAPQEVGVLTEGEMGHGAHWEGREGKALKTCLGMTHTLTHNGGNSRFTLDLTSLICSCQVPLSTCSSVQTPVITIISLNEL